MDGWMDGWMDDLRLHALFTVTIQSNFNGSNTYGTMNICSRRVVRANEC